MGFGGSEQAMIKSLKYNKSQLRKKNYFRDRKKELQSQWSQESLSKLEGNAKHLNEVQVRSIVKEIRTRMTTENRKTQKLKAFLIAAIILLMSMIFALAIKL